MSKKRTTKKVYLAFDLGASSGRAVLGFVEHGKLRMKEINRFSNEHHLLGKSLYWDFIALWKHIVESIRICSGIGYPDLNGIGIDTWGVDFGLIGKDGRLIGQPFCYRDEITKGADKVIRSTLGVEKLYKITGLSLTRVATLPQLIGIKTSAASERLRIADCLLMMPDLFRYYLCGHKAVEKTIAGSSQLANVRTGKWSSTIFKAFNLPKRLMPDIILPGTIAGKLDAGIAKTCKVNQVPIIAVAGHDTASAAAAVPYADEGSVFISCGTWSILGQFMEKPLTTPETLKYGFINEFGVDSILFVKNLMGLYLFENYKRELNRSGQKLSYSQMVSEAAVAKPFKAFLDMNCPLFFVANEPQSLVRQFIRKTNQSKKLQRSEIIRLILEGLVFSYKEYIEKLEKIIGRKISRICMVGGGIQNRLLCQMTADATCCEVIAGPAEATIAANFALQALAMKQLGKVEDIRMFIRNSFKLKKYQPKSPKGWNDNYSHYKKICEKAKNYINER